MGGGSQEHPGAQGCTDRREEGWVAKFEKDSLGFQFGSGPLRASGDRRRAGWSMRDEVSMHRSLDTLSPKSFPSLHFASSSLTIASSSISTIIRARNLGRELVCFRLPPTTHFLRSFTSTSLCLPRRVRTIPRMSTPNPKAFPLADADLTNKVIIGQNRTRS